MRQTSSAVTIRPRRTGSCAARRIPAKRSSVCLHSFDDSMREHNRRLSVATVISFLSKQATTTAYKYKRIFLAKKGPSLLARTFRLWLRTEGRSAGTAACQPANENRVDLRRQAIGHYAVKDDGDTIPRPITTRMTSVHKNILSGCPVTYQQTGRTHLPQECSYRVRTSSQQR